MFACNGILLIMKAPEGVKLVKEKYSSCCKNIVGSSEKLHLGNLDAKRLGHKDYVQVM